MTLELLIVAAYRTLGALPVLRWAFAGGLLALLIDLGDLFVIAGLDLGGVRNYQAVDKWLDQVYLAAFLIVALRWKALPGAIAVTLYLYRLAGFTIFEATGERWVLLAFPNVFEFWFLYVAATLWRARRRGITTPSISLRHATLALVTLTTAKLAHEWLLRGGRGVGHPYPPVRRPRNRTLELSVTEWLAPYELV